MSTTEQQQSNTNSIVPETEHYDFQYEKCDRKSYGSQQEVADAWAEGKYPTHNVGGDGAILYTGTPHNRGLRGSGNWADEGRYPDDARGSNTNFYGVQHKDGSGTLWHYNTREAIRLTDGTIISNQQCWSAGFAHCSKPDYDYEVPFDAIESHLDNYDTVFDIGAVMGQPETKVHYREYSDEFHSRTGINARNSIVMINGDVKSYGIYVGRDLSIINGESHFTFRLSVDQLSDIEHPDEALDLLVHDAVRESNLDVVDSLEYTKTRLDEDEQEAHLEAGGNLTKSESRYRDKMLNLQQYRADLQGNVIVRHGEFMFIPRPEIEDVPEQGTKDAAEIMDSHRAKRFHGARSPLPQECPQCHASSIEISENGDCSCTECGAENIRKIYAHGQITHDTNDHNAVNLGETWHEVVQHDVEVRTYDSNPTNGGGGGWD